MLFPVLTVACSIAPRVGSALIVEGRLLFHCRTGVAVVCGESCVWLSPPRWGGAGGGSTGEERTGGGEVEEILLCP